MVFLPPFLIFAVVFLSFSKTVLTPSETTQETIDPTQRLSAAFLEYAVLKELKREVDDQTVRLEVRSQSSITS